MSSIATYNETRTVEHADGSIEQSSVTKSTNIVRNNEPDYIKLYTRMWCEFNGIPETYRDLFLQLALRMTYCNANDLDNSQLVNTGKPWSDAIMKSLGWQRAMYQRGIKALCDCGAIRRKGKGVYQISPRYAAKGEWKYNPRLAHGGVEQLVATFDFKNGTVDTKIDWADDGTSSDMNAAYRTGMGVRPQDQTVLSHTTIAPQEQKQEPVPADIAVLPFG